MSTIHIIYLRADSNIFSINRSNLLIYPYFEKLFEKYPNHGTSDSPFLMDFDKKSIKHILEVARNGDEYGCPNKEQITFDKLGQNLIDPQESFIELNVGGYIFNTTKETLKKCEYFEAILTRWDNKIPKYIDRDGKSFRYILRYLRNPNYLIPTKYYYDVLFYGLPGFKKPKNCTPNFPKELPYTGLIGERNAIDEYITGNPQITCFKTVYRRHTDFYVNNMIIQGEQTDNIVNFQIPINKNVNLISEIFLHMVPQDCNSLASIEDIIKIDFYVGDNLHDSINKDTLEMHLHFLYTSGLKSLYEQYLNKNQLYIAVPLIGKNMNFDVPFPTMCFTYPCKIVATLKNSIKYTTNLNYKYYSLDKEEYRRFEQVGHEYLFRRYNEHSTIVNNDKMDIPMPMVCSNIRYIIIKIEHGNHFDNGEPLEWAEMYIKDNLTKVITPEISRSNFVMANIYDKPTFFNPITTQKFSYYLVPFCMNLLDHQPSGSITISTVNDIKFILKINPNADAKKIVFITCYNNICRIIKNTYEQFTFNTNIKKMEIIPSEDVNANDKVPPTFI